MMFGTGQKLPHDGDAARRGEMYVTSKSVSDDDREGCWIASPVYDVGRAVARLLHLWVRRDEDNAQQRCFTCRLRLAFNVPACQSEDEGPEDENAIGWPR